MSQRCFMADGLALVTNVGDELGLYEVRVHLGDGDGKMRKAPFPNRQIWHYRKALWGFFFIWRCLPKLLLLPGYLSLRQLAQIIIFIFCCLLSHFIFPLPTFQISVIYRKCSKIRKSTVEQTGVEVLSEENLTGVFFHLE